MGKSHENCRNQIFTAFGDEKGAAGLSHLLDLTSTPCQHFSGRTLWDNFKSLWSGWVVEEVYDPPSEQERPAVKVFFGGDTAYRTVLDGQDEEKVPVCPAFEEVGKAFGGFDFAMIPIGYARYSSPI